MNINKQWGSYEVGSGNKLLQRHAAYEKQKNIKSNKQTFFLYITIDSI